jgi:mono/diheme cytochrome c family protein
MVRRSFKLAALLVSLAGTAFAGDTQSFDRVERGRYLAVLSDCAACHTAPGGAPFAGGVALQTPFGTLVAPNITPDPYTGIGNMTDEEFLSVLHEGRGHNGKRLYPAMPYTAYTKLADDDVLAMRSYFATILPVSNEVVSNRLPFPLNVRFAMVFWNGLNFTPGRYRPNPEKSTEWNRGAYIVEGAAHCGACHTPKTMLGGDKKGAALTGATLQGWFSPDLTNDPRKGIGGWSKDDLVQYLKKGTNKWALASGPMAEAVSHSTSHMTDDDIRAIATYLKDSGGGSTSARPELVKANNGAMRAGSAIYKDSCAACHRDLGEGEVNLFPRLAGSALVQSDDPTTLARVILHGTRAVSTSAAPTAPAMPSFDWRLGDEQVAAVLTYIRNSWGNVAQPVSAGAVAHQRAWLAGSP